jgi:NAD(P)-dependent dehydrogenase (short-subunit alcohol dehydrogenase family)
MRPMPGLSERAVLITGATDGLGRALAIELAKRGASLVLHGRDEERGRSTLGEVERLTGNRRLRWERADFESLDEVRAMAQRLLAAEAPIDVLVNNAGVGTSLPGEGTRMESRDGLELRFQVNYLAGFLLTRLVMPLLRKGPRARIVNVASAGQMAIDFDDVMLERAYDGTRAYCQSKLAQVMFTLDLAEELAGTGVTANCLHPATYMPTKIVIAARGGALSSIEEGVEATMRLVAGRELDGVTGRYFNGLHEARADPQAYDEGARERLRTLSKRLVGLDP